MPTSRNKERGTATIELALVFSLLFSLLWGVISFTFPLIVLQAMNRAVTEAARVAATVAVPSSSADNASYEAKVREVALNELRRQMEWLPANWIAPISITSDSPSNVTFIGNGACTSARPNCVVVVRLTYSNYATNPIVPSFHLPGLGQLPPLPTSLEATSRIVL